MARLCLVGLILAGIFVIQAMAGESEQSQSGFAHKEADHHVSTAAEPSEAKEKPEEAEAPSIRRLGKHHSDKSVAGGGVIIGGLVTAIFAAIFCYIRVTRKRSNVKPSEITG